MPVEPSVGGMMRVPRAAAIAAALIVTGAGCGLFGPGTDDGGRICRVPDTGAPPADSPPMVRTIVSGLCLPWGVAFLPDGTALVTERDTLRLLSVTVDGRVTELKTFPDARPGGRPPRGAAGGGEGGLLGVAVSPNFATDRWVYVFYATVSDNRVARFQLTEPGNVAGPHHPILTGIPVADDAKGSGFYAHHGGRIAFGPDGMLYVGTGETYYTREIAQDPRNLGGKILRLTPEGKPAPGNPVPDSPVWSLGHRNVQGLAWDSKGRLYAAELGEDRFDELNLIEAGKNYGWPVVEGVSHDPRFVDPIATWAPADASPSGIAVVGDHIYVACLRGQRLYRVGLDGGNAEPLLVGQYGRLRTVALAPDGSLWVTTSNRDGLNLPKPGDDRIVRLTL